MVLPLIPIVGSGPTWTRQATGEHAKGGRTMLKREINELLTRTGPGTPMGELFRRYWLPALLAEELPENDCPPVRVKLLSERLIAFRDSDGRYGLIDEFCAHRGVSLWFGRSEEGGLRCAYHGWKYDVNGRCVEVPSEPEDSRFPQKVKLTSYPLVQVGDVLWTYLGDPVNQPELPEFEFVRVPSEQSYTSKRWQECNWLQALEGGIDSSHVSWLHSAGLKNDPLFKGIAMQDASLQESMGPIVDRTKERLVSTDAGIIKARQKLRKAAEALRDDGTTPPGVDAGHHRVRSASVLVPKDEAFIDAAHEALAVTPGVTHASV